MLFSSLIFASCFLPLVILFRASLRDSLRLPFLLAASLFFYFWGEPLHFWVMLVSIGAAWLGGLGAAAPGPRGRLAAALAIAVNLGLLLYFKYASFLAGAINGLAAKAGFPGPIKIPEIALPLGISFFVFQSISYILDVRRNQCPAERGLLKTAVYISLFPQLIAGPIVRFGQIVRELERPLTSLEGHAAGLARFCFGLGKKTLLANPAGALADLAFGLPASELTAPLAWLGALAYAFQIYFDFSGYSDMAIGLGRALGFTFPENFNYPYLARSMTDFWRRWHISLSSWFRDYLYIPLGGNRRGRGRTVLNLLLVFALCGLWHGASRNFLLWGLWHGLFLGLEKLNPFKKWPAGRAKAAAGRLYTLMAVLAGWVLIRAETWVQARDYCRAMFDFRRWEPDMLFWEQINGAHLALFAAAIFFSLGGGRAIMASRLRPFAALVVLAAAYVFMVSSTYNPFIYFRF